MTLPAFDANEACGDCGFEARSWDVPDSIRALSHAAAFMALGCESMPAAMMDMHPPNAGFSIADTITDLSALIHDSKRMTAEIVGHSLDPDEAIHSSLEPLLAELASEAATYADVLSLAAPVEMDRGLTATTARPTTVADTMRHAVHAVFHSQRATARIRSELGDLVGPLTGSVVQLSASGGGLPKVPVLNARIDKSGLVGDRQASRRHHGAPFQALCLFSAEVIEAFAAQGHPIGFGSAGENITVRGVDWSLLRAGLEVSIGDMVCLLTAPAVPCAQNKPWFTDGDFTHLSHSKHPGQSRWYASVLNPATINPGDMVTVA